MTHIDEHEIEAILAAAEDDPRRRHIAECARCRSRVMLYQSLFESAGEPRDEDANRKLEAVIRRELEGPAVAPFRTPVVHGSRRLRWLAAAAVLVAAAGITFSMLRAPGGDETLRGPKATSFAVAAAHALPDGGFDLRWDRVAGAEAYEVVIYDVGYAEIARYPVTGATNLVVPAGVLPPKSALLWRVTARSAGRDVAESEVGTLQTP